jgi:soluble lytic murein transglycosylase-like protein
MDLPLVAQVKQIATMNGVDPALACAVVEQESGFNTWAMRYEPAFFVRYVAPILNLSDTERQARATSWGLFQVMGQVARERGFTQKFLSSLCDPDFGIPVGIQFLKHCLDACGGDEAKALLRWNGGSNAEYPIQVLARKDKYSEPKS